MTTFDSSDLTAPQLNDAIAAKTTYTVSALPGADFTSIQAAITYLTSNSLPGRVLIKNGTYALGSTGITMSANTLGIELIGESKRGVMITYTGSSSAIDIGSASSDTRYLRIENLTIDNTNNEGLNGLRLRRVKNSYFANIFITGFSSTANPGAGLRLDGNGSYTGDNYFYGIHVDTCQEGIALTSTSNANHFFGCTVRTTLSHASARGINMGSGVGNTFVGFTVENSTSGIRINTDKNTFAGFYFENNTTAILFESGADDNVLVGMSNVSDNTTFVTIGGSRNIVLGTNTFISGVTAPAAADSTGIVGQIATDAGFIYVCTAPNTWERVAIATW